MLALLRNPRRTTKLLVDDETKEELLGEHHEIRSNPSCKSQINTSILTLIVHFILGLCWVMAIWRLEKRSMVIRDHEIRQLEFPPIAEAIEYHEQKFDISGGGTRDHPITPYEGPPTWEKDMRWWELINVGFIALTPEMNKTLKFPTQPASETDDTPLVGLEVFHQLHCLNALRKIAYGVDKFFDPSARQDQIHIDHCIDYLRQTLMCHADVTPIRNKARKKPYNPAIGPWVPDFAVHHTCRNFEKIHAWAAQYNTSGFVLEPPPGVNPHSLVKSKGM